MLRAADLVIAADQQMNSTPISGRKVTMDRIGQSVISENALPRTCTR
jgi:hypothetical protein